jgi:hypothetical protein
MSDDLGLATFRRLVSQTLDSFRPGMEAAAAPIETAAAGTDAYAGMSGATRASTIVYVADSHDSGDAEIVSAYNAAAGRLQGFSGHEGQAHLGGVPGPGQHEVWAVETVPTDYILGLETDNAGEKAFLADSGFQQAPQAFQAFVAVVKGAWH